MKMLIGSLLTNAKRRFFAIIAGVLVVSAFSLYAGPPQLISARNSSIAYLPGGNGDSVAPWISDDGRYVVFSSLANDLTPGGNSQLVLNVYLHDRDWNTTELVSANAAGTGGGNGHSISGQASAYGRYVVFQSNASDLVPGDTNGVSDIFLRDTYTGTTLLISEAADGGCANGASTEPVMTPDGTCVVFISAATNLVAGDTNGIPDVFVRDLITQTTSLVSVKAAGNGSPPMATMATPTITPDGRFVAFFSTAINLAPGVPATSQGEIYVRDLLAGATIWASMNAAATVSTVLQLDPMPSTHPVISDDGRYVAFKTGWTNGTVSPATLGALGAPAVVFFQYDSVNGTTTILSTNGYPPWPNCDDVYGPEMTPDGRFIVYVDYNMLGTTPTNSNVHLWDRLTGTNVVVVTHNSDFTAHTPAVSQDGRYVTFLCDANLVSNFYSVSNGLHIYRYGGQISPPWYLLLDVDTNSVGSLDETGVIPVLSADGSCVVFSARDGGLIRFDNNNAQDIFVWTASPRTNTLISVHDPLAVFQSGNLASTLGPLSISGNGQLVAFASFASDLVPNEFASKLVTTNFNGFADIFVRDLMANSNILVSVGLDGNSGQGGPSFNPIISADGRYVVFLSGATNLVAGDHNGSVDVFRRDLQTGITEWVNDNSGGASLGSSVILPASSQDGRYIAFFCTNIYTSLHGLFWRDMDSGVTNLVFSSIHPSRQISMSADGQRLAWFDSSSRLSVWDANLQANIYSNTVASPTSAALSPAGNRPIEFVSLSEYRPDQGFLAVERGRPLCCLCHRRQARGCRQQRDQ
jgi:Tol biopolymer transport system component